MKKYILILIAVLSLSFVSCQSDLDSRFKKDAETLNKRLCPRKVYNGITIDSIRYRVEDRTFGYYYTMDDSIYTDTLIAQAREKLREALRQEIVKSIELKKAKENQAQFQYTYFAKSERRIVLRFTFGPNDYGTPAK